MSEPSTPSESAPEGKRKTPVWVPIAVVVGALPAVFALLIFGWIVRVGWAHDEDRCPFHELETRPIEEGVAVREDTRRCMEDIEEHRWLVVRDGAEPLELGRAPLEGVPGDTPLPWEARVEDGRIIVDVTRVDRGLFTFREPAAAATAAPVEH